MMDSRITSGEVDDWIDALESGAYKQCKGRLRSSKNEFCCLGVLAETNKRFVRIPLNDKGQVYAAGEVEITNGNKLPFRFIDDDFQRYLVSMNDDGEPFWKIAHVIRGMKTEMIKR